MIDEGRIVYGTVSGWWLFWVGGGVLSSWAQSDWTYLTLFGSVATGSALLLWGMLWLMLSPLRRSR